MRAELKMRRRNIALLVAYDGTNYNGFQRQNLHETLEFGRADCSAVCVTILFCAAVGFVSYAG